MHGQMGLGQHDGAGDAGRLARGILEGVEEAADDRQPVPGAGCDTERLELRRVVQEFVRATAVMEIGDQVQAIHDAILLRFT
jgi:hypothetical protein